MQNNMNNFLMNEPLKMSDHSSADNSDDYLFYKKKGLMSNFQHSL